MTTTEFSDLFDVQYNNIISNAAPGLNGYEKSVFLTQAQKELIIGIYNGTFNGESFENTEEVRRYIDEEVVVYNTSAKITPPYRGVSSKSVFYNIPEDVWFRVYESVTFDDETLGCKNGQSDIEVLPITHDEYHTVKKNPFRGPTDRKVLRLDSGASTIEIVSKYVVSNYYLRYLIQPSPIIVEELSQYNVSIDGETDITECKLNSAIHQDILNRAVELAREAWGSGASS